MVQKLIPYTDTCLSCTKHTCTYIHVHAVFNVNIHILGYSNLEMKILMAKIKVQNLQ